MLLLQTGSRLKHGSRARNSVIPIVLLPSLVIQSDLDNPFSINPFASGSGQ